MRIELRHQRRQQQAFAACAGIWLLEPPGSFALLPALLCLAVLVIASNVRFETPFGYTVATQLAFVPMLAFYRRSPMWAVALPAIAAAYVALTIDSAFQHLRGRGGEWKGRVGPRAALSSAGRP